MRIIDESKLERIKTTTVQIIVREGYQGATIAKIAKNADVSEGYLYRFYTNKSELVKAIFHEAYSQLLQTLQEYLDEWDGLQAFLQKYYTFITRLFKKNADEAYFAFLMDHNYCFDVQENLLQEIRELCNRILFQARNSGEISQDIVVEDIYLYMFSVPLQFIKARLSKIILYKEIDKNDIDHLLYNTLKVLR